MTIYVASHIAYVKSEQKINPFPIFPSRKHADGRKKGAAPMACPPRGTACPPASTGIGVARNRCRAAILPTLAKVLPTLAKILSTLAKIFSMLEKIFSCLEKFFSGFGNKFSSVGDFLANNARRMGGHGVGSGGQSYIIKKEVLYHIKEA
ncbi:MAG: hypothetical protein MR516_04900 [Bacteroidales bacterium]|nr:hypothetical protein [Bacteroidales bacterium]MCI7315578.1 hypothetical protein [Bacteroidales bacterium]